MVAFGAGLVCAAAPAASLGATVAVTTDASSATPKIGYFAPAGETNNVTIDLAGGTYTITDTGAPLIAGAGCTQVNTSTATCPAASANRVTVNAGDMSDTILMNAKPPLGTTLIGGEGNDTINGGPGTDHIFGGNGGDAIDARLGNDTVDTGGGDPAFEAFDIVNGGGGFDTLDYHTRSEPVIVDLKTTPGFAVDPLDFGAGESVDNFEKIVGGSGDDFLVGGILADEFLGNAGSDIICGGLGNDTVDYTNSPGPVNVSLDGSLATDARLALPLIGSAQQTEQYRRARTDCRPTDESALIPGSVFAYPEWTDRSLHQNDCVFNDSDGFGSTDCVGEDIENITGGPGDDTLTGNNPDPLEGQGPRVEPHGVNILRGGGGDDTLDGKLGADVMDGGPNGPKGDTVTYADRTEDLNASIDGAANDGSPGDVNARSGETDSIGQDIENLIGGSGSDKLVGDSNANNLQGGGGDDVLRGNEGNDTLGGGDGNDELEAGSGNDTLSGDAGNDALTGGFGADSLDGGDGIDSVDYSDSTTSVYAVPDGIANDGKANEGDNLAGTVETLIGGTDNDTLVGNDGPGTIDGRGGSDTLDGGGGADSIIGGDGFDNASYGGRTNPVTVNLAAGVGGEGGENDTIAADVEGVIGGAGNDSLTGNDAVNILIGGPGDDTLDGAGGADQVFGGVGNDMLLGGSGSDTLAGEDGNDNLQGGTEADGLNGGDGNDLLDGGPGNDILTGGPGDDAAIYASRSKDVDVTMDGADNDGESGERDQIRLTVESTKTGAGNDSINVRDGLKGEVSCGRGTDSVIADATDVIASDCEQTDVSAASTRCRVRNGSLTMTRSGRVKLRISCPVAAKGTLTLQTAGAYKAAKKTRKKVKLGRKSFSLKAGKSKTLSVKLTKKARRLVKRNKRLHARAIVSVKKKAGAKASKSSKTLTIKAPKKGKK
jgi:Ca2+-binding RTX toxin-like protein